MIRRVPFTELPHAHTGEPVAPLDEQPEPLHWEWIDPAGRERVYASTADELLEVWMPGYLTGTRRAQLEARIEHAARTRAELAATLVDDAEADTGPLDADIRAVLLGSSWDPPTVLEWVHPIPLVLLDVFYVPFTPRAAPRSTIDGDVAEPSNMLWLRPSSPAAYLRSLATAGVATLAEHSG